MIFLHTSYFSEVIFTYTHISMMFMYTNAFSGVIFSHLLGIESVDGII